MSDEKLIGWLVFIRFSAGTPIPNPVRLALLDRGWIEEAGFEDEHGRTGYVLTPRGSELSDLNAADWGVELSWGDE